ncbi:MAG: hypothetical protein V7K57_21925 [Nostoc sp.]|uniref:hypothetical protein n=1 Tax=Nostoc sp. TaxID=1180 RepID=UPI002FF6F1FB
MPQGWCISGDVVTSPGGVTKRAIFYNTEPQITYHSNASDEAYWGNKYTAFNNYYSFVDGSYTIYQSDEPGCQIVTTPPVGAKKDYDCINGACIEKSKYNTPGLYQSLDDCQTVCGGTSCGGQCISNPDWAQIESLASQIRSKECG